MHGPRWLIIIPGVLAALSSFEAPAWGAWPSDPTVNVPICAAANVQYNPAIAADGSGGAIIAWQDLRDGSNSDIYAQRVDGSGTVQWAADGVLLSTTGSDADPAILSDGSGGAFVTWGDLVSGIYVQLINAAGIVQWAANGVLLTDRPADEYTFPKLVSDGAGGVIVTWGRDHVYAQRVDAKGVARWAFRGVVLDSVETSTGGLTRSPTIVSDGAGGAIVTWLDQRNNGGVPNIYAQRVDSTGVPQWTAFGVALCTAPDLQLSPTIASDGAGGAIVTWFDYRNGGFANSDIYAQRVSLAGVPQWTTDGVAVCTAASEQIYPTIVSDGSGGAIVSWEDYRSSIWKIYAQHVNSAGVPQWTADGIALSTKAGTQAVGGGGQGLGNQQAGTETWIASDGAGGAIVTWTNFNVSTFNVYAQRVNAAGVPLWTADGAAIGTNNGGQMVPAIVSTCMGGVIATWEDYRSGGSNSDIYAQNVNADGTLGGTTFCVPAAVPLSTPVVGFSLTASPNPARGSCMLAFNLPRPAAVRLEIFDVAGRWIRGLLDGSLMVGQHTVVWDGMTTSGKRAEGGVYFARLTAAGERREVRVVVVSN